MLHINIVEESRQYKKKANAHAPVKRNVDIGQGDIIEFTSGYHNNIRYTAEVAGVGRAGAEEEVYIVWQCYWSPIEDDERSDIKIVSSPKS